jgi:flagellar biosynthetic protein FlhB
MAASDRERRTLPPTPKKKRESRQEGKIARSQDLAGWAVLLVAVFAMGPLFRLVSSSILGVFVQASRVMAHPDKGMALAVFENGLKVFAEVGLAIAGAFMAVAILVNVGQVGFVFASKAAMPKLSRIDPRQGLRRIFSLTGLWQMVKTFSKVAVISLIAYNILSGVAHTVVGSSPVDLEPVLVYAGQSVTEIARDVGFLMLAVAAADYLFQRRRVNQQIRMTREEFKDEMRQTEGDPITRRRIRRQQVKMSRLRMMAAVARADVVITNPTHVAVALTYNQKTHVAPKVVAKGEGYMALMIKDEAFKVGVPVVEDPPLARALHSACEVDDVIPRELYMAVAHLLAFVYSLSHDARLLGVAFRRPVSSMAL